MDLTIILQVAIGILFVWVMLAVITSQIQEWIASIFAWRADMLESSIVNMLGDKDLTKKIYNHPIIKGLWTNNGKRKPGGIPEDKFALVLFEAVTNADATTAEIKDSFLRLKQNVANLKVSENHELQQFATSLDTLLQGIETRADNTAQAFTEARLRVESWFNDSMERLSGSYKRRVQIVAIIVGVAVAAILNVDTVTVANTLWRDPVLREAVVTQASQAQNPSDQSTGSVSAQDIVNSMEQLNALTLPVGWSQGNIPVDAGGWSAKALGIAISGMAAAQGAPYWFDLMRKLLSRDSGSSSAKG